MTALVAFVVDILALLVTSLLDALRALREESLETERGAWAADVDERAVLG